MSAFTSDFDRGRAGYSPDHVDALVWALSELMVEPVAGWGLIEWTRLEAERLNAPRNDLNDTTGFVRMRHRPTAHMFCSCPDAECRSRRTAYFPCHRKMQRRCWASDGSELSLTWLSSVKRGRCRAMSDVWGQSGNFLLFRSISKLTQMRHYPAVGGCRSSMKILRVEKDGATARGHFPHDARGKVAGR